MTIIHLLIYSSIYSLYHILNSFINLHIIKWMTLVKGDLKAPFLIATTLRCRRGCYFFPWKLVTLVEGDPKAHFSKLLHWGVGEGATSSPELLHFTLDSYLVMLSVKQGGIKNYFLSLWYDSTWDWTSVSWTIDEHYLNYVQIYKYLFIHDIKLIYKLPYLQKVT